MSDVLQQFGLSEEVNTDGETSSEVSDSEEGTVAAEAESTESETVESAGTDDAGDTGTADVQKKAKPVKLKSLEEQLDEEKGFRVRMQRELKQAKEQLTHFSELKSELDVLRGELNASKKPETPEPEISFDDNPIGYLKAQNDLITQSLAYLLNQQNTSTKVTKEQAEINKLVAQGRKAFDAFASENEDFKSSFEHLTNTRLKQYRTIGYSDDEATNQVDQEFLVILRKSIENDQNPAEIFYNISKQNGFSSKKVAEESIKKASKGSFRNKTLSNSGTMVDKDVETVRIEDMVNASDEDFDKYWEIYSKKSKRA